MHFSLAKPSDDDIVIVSGCRSAITKAKKGGLSSLKADQILAEVLKDLIKRAPEIQLEEIGDIVIGSVLQPGGGQAMARVAMFEAGFPYKIPVATINRQCASGLEAVAAVVGHIMAGDYRVGIAGGVESMSSTTFQNARPVVDTKSVKTEPNAAACMIPMGLTSDNIANRFQISRMDQDRFALKSHRKAEAARQGGKFAQEITVIGKAVMDDGVRPGTSMEALSALKPAFSKPSSGGTTTAGNSSQLSDGAAATLVCKGKTVKELNLPMLCLWRAYAVVGVPPDIMGIGPAFAIPVAVRKAGLSLDDIDVFEINEAFAAQTVFCIKFLGLREDRVNPLGGAIALGHPLGSSGARLLVTAANFLQANNKRYAAVSLCVGTGMGAAAVIENPHYDPSTDEATSRAKL